MFYRNGSGQQPHTLAIPGCPTPCPLPLFVRLTRRVVPQDWDAECQNPQAGPGKKRGHLPYPPHTHFLSPTVSPLTSIPTSLCRTHCNSSGRHRRSAECGVSWHVRLVLEEVKSWTSGNKESPIPEQRLDLSPRDPHAEQTLWH